jgi:hypothetical protein
MGLTPSKEWENLPPVPESVSPESARERLMRGFGVRSGDGENITFDTAVLDHWEPETDKNPDDVNRRLARLDMAIDTVTNPTEVWRQDSQKAYVKLFEQSTGGKRGCAVFVTADGKVRSYFPNRPSWLDTCRKGVSCTVFNQPGTSDNFERIKVINRDLIAIRAKLYNLLNTAEDRNLSFQAIAKIRELLQQAAVIKVFVAKR